MNEEKISLLKEALKSHDAEFTEEIHDRAEVESEFGYQIMNETMPHHLKRLAAIDSRFVSEVRKIITNP